MGMDVTTAAYHNSYDVAKKETKRAGDRGSVKTDNLQDLRDVLAVGKSVERTDLEKMMKKYDPEAYAQYSKLVQESQNTISFMSQWMTKMKKALQDGTIVSGRPKPPVRNVKGNVNVSISKEARELLDGRVVKKPRPPYGVPNAEKQNTTHFSNINDPNDHGFFTKIWDDHGNVVYDADWDKKEMTKEPQRSNTTHFPNINDPNDHGFIIKAWDEDGNVVWDASWNNDVEPQKPEPGMPPHWETNPGQLPHWTEISRDLAEHGFYKNMTRQEIDHLEGFLRSMRSAKDLNIFADKHTSGELREFLKELAKGYASNDRGRMQ